jgi:aldose 1-epimerase
MKFCKLMGIVSLVLFSGAAIASEAVKNADKAEKAKARRAEMRQRMARMSRPARVKPFGKLADGREAKIWRLQGRGGLTLDVTDYGGRVVRVYAPDRYGNLADVTLGWNTPAEYEKYGFSMGTIIGRFGNRIAAGKFTLEGKEYQLAINEKKAKRYCNLHSGPDGWDKRIWNAKLLREGPVQGIEFSLESPDGDMGFPGKVNVKVTYRVLPNNVWTVDYEAVTDKTTVLNVTHHSYWNLAGEASGNVLKQKLQIFADQYTKTDAGLIPTENAPVKGTGFDFTELREIGAKADLMKADASLAPMDNWYDHNFVLRGKNGELKPAATMYDPVSGRKLEILTTEPAMQMYGAQNMTDAIPAKTAGRNLCQFAGVALETQHFPDSPNRPDFPSTVLKPGETFRSRTEYRFSAE